MACTSGRIDVSPPRKASVAYASGMGEIARRLGLATPTVTRAATRMEAAGLLRREPHPGDRRLVRLVLTERGRSLEGVIAAETDKVTERALATFGPGERETVIRALAAIRRNLTGA
jgi:MarR family transcriptional regulator, organic hydroperoxide resistance regulator